LAASFGDGSTKLFIIPHPHVLKKHIGVANDEPLYGKYIIIYIYKKINIYYIK